MNCLLLIPARGGSRGVPRKCLRRVGGVPLVGRAARLACAVRRRLGRGSRVVCSTDDVEIAAVARAWGAEVPFLRPAALATDEAATIDVVLHALDALGGSFDAVVLLQPTSPFTTEKDVLEALALFKHPGAPVVSLCESEHPVAWTYRRDPIGQLTAVLPGGACHQRQQAGATYRLNGAIYIASPSLLRARGTFLVDETRGYIMPQARSMDIDTPGDLDSARGLATGSAASPGALQIGGRAVGHGHPAFLIAEAGVNHNGDLDLARRLVDAAARANADAVKFQTFKAERLVTADAPKAAYQRRTTGADETQLEMLRRLELTEAHHAALQAHCAARNIVFLSTPFDELCAEQLRGLGVPAFKIGSGDVTNLPFLRALAQGGLPLILSTGMATLPEVDQAVAAVNGASAGRCPLVLLHCVSSYPADPSTANLRAMETMRQAFGVPVGYSDHTPGLEVPLAAAALGACVIEKHFTLDRAMDGPDHAASLEPDELEALVRGVRAVEAALGHGRKEPAAVELDVARVARKSIVAARDLAPTTVLTSDAVVVKRPGTGLPPAMLPELMGRTVAVHVPEGTLLSLEMLL
jgi:N-acetylneuraminate synthase